MERKIVAVSLIAIISVALFCGCTENNARQKQTYTWTAKQVINDMPVDLEWDDGIQLLYNTLEDGDSLVIQDSITDIYYDPDTDTTVVVFEWSEGEENNSYAPFFEGDITDKYTIGQEVRITVTIKYVEISYGGFDFKIEIFEEQWENEEYFINNYYENGQGLKALPQSDISAV